MNRAIPASLSCILPMILMLAPAVGAQEQTTPGVITPARSPREAAGDLLKRIIPIHADKFILESIPSADGLDVFEIETADGKVIIRGSGALAMSMGINWYLKEYCHCHVSWYGNQLNLPDPLPAVKPKIRQVAWARYRYFLNYCCFGYSLPFWDWAQWEKLIDWMALNGINAPLAVTGQEAVWQAVCKRLELTDQQTQAFLAGPPFLPFGWMGCLDGWGGPLPATWVAKHEELGKRILARERELGMTPVLQGFTGHVPPAVAQKFPQAKMQKIRWIDWETQLLDPLDPLFSMIAAIFLDEQTKRFGTDHLYAADTFIEMEPPNGDPKYLAQLGKAIYEGMTNSDPRAVWVLQGWAFSFKKNFWTQPRIAAFLEPVPDDRMLVLDLHCESAPYWNHTQAFCGKPWAWCYVQNFGRAVHLGGAMNKIATELPAVRRDPASGRLAGLGFVNEGLCYNPPVYDLMFEMAWRDQAVDLADWFSRYADRRYGKSNPHARAAWSIFKDTVYSAPCRTRSALHLVPSLKPSGLAPYSNTRLAEAWNQLLQAADELGEQETYQFDLVNTARQVLSNHAALLQREIVNAYEAKDQPRFEAASRKFLDLIGEMDELLATRSEFLLGSWIEDARRWGSTDAEKARLEWNARRVLTLWGDTRSLRDYARKEWSGMFSSFYANRWKMYLNEVSAAMKKGDAPDGKAIDRKLFDFERAWSDPHPAHRTTPTGDPVAIARRLFAKYSDAFKPTATSLTTAKPVTCSHALPGHDASNANDGWIDTQSYWATDVRQDPASWWQVDLQEPTEVGRVVVVLYYADKRSYGFTVEISRDGKTWQLAADRSQNKELSTDKGISCEFAPRTVRYLRVTVTNNSANTGRHLVEVMAFGK